MELLNKVVIITGGANGIGKECALRLKKEGAKIIIADIDQDNGSIVEKQLGKDGIFIKTDITKEEEVINLRDEVLKKYKKIDILINNAAKQTQNAFFDMKVEEFKDVINVNLNGTFICSNIIGKTMGKGGKIINMLSVHYNLPRKNKYHYDASKAGVAMLTKEMALDLVKRGITVNAISYGACNTPMNSDWINDKEKVKETKDKIPMKWIAEPEEIANFVKIILSDFSEYTTGSIFNIDGGRSIK